MRIILSVAATALSLAVSQDSMQPRFSFAPAPAGVVWPDDGSRSLRWCVQGECREIRRIHADGTIEQWI